MIGAIRISVTKTRSQDFLRLDAPSWTLSIHSDKSKASRNGTIWRPHPGAWVGLFVDSCAKWMFTIQPMWIIEQRQIDPWFYSGEQRCCFLALFIQFLGVWIDKSLVNRSCMKRLVPWRSDDASDTWQWSDVKRSGAVHKKTLKTKPVFIQHHHLIGVVLSRLVSCILPFTDSDDVAPEFCAMSSRPHYVVIPLYRCLVISFHQHDIIDAPVHMAYCLA